MIIGIAGKKQSGKDTAAPDAYTHSAGYNSPRSLDIITHHKEWGFMERKRVNHLQALAAFEEMERAA